MDPKRKHEAVSRALQRIRQLGGDYDAKNHFGNHPHAMGVEIVIGKHEPTPPEGSPEEEKSESPLFEQSEDAIMNKKLKR